MTKPRKPKVHRLVAQSITAGAPVVGTPRVYTDPPDDHPVYALIGRLAAQQARFESLLDSIIANLVGDGELAACLTAQLMGPYPRFLSIIALIKHRGLNAEFVKSVRSLEGDTRSTLDKRNRSIHDPWLISGESLAQFRRMPRTSHVYGFEDVDPESLQKTIAEVSGLFTIAVNLSAKISAALEAMRRR